MSSRYAMLCFSHDPALEFLDGDDFQSGNGGRERIEALALSRDPEHMQGHEKCDLLIGRYSYPLIEVGCPGAQPIDSPVPRRCVHRDVVWIEIEWLRLLFAVHRLWDTTSGPLDEDFSRMADAANVLTRRRPCWTSERLTRIAHLLGAS